MPDDVLAAHGAVSAQVAMAMATGGRARTGADLGGLGHRDRRTGRRQAGQARRADLRGRGRRGRRRRQALCLARGPDREQARSAEAALELLLERVEAEAVGCRGRAIRVRSTPPTRHDAAADRLGAGLAPAREARPIRPAERIHVVGAAGAGASAAALLAAHAGAIVTGCDPGGPSPYTPALEAAGIHVAPEHSAAHVTRAPRPDRLAVTKALTAIDPDQPELAAARDAGIPVEPWQQVVADAAVGRTLVGVAGTHGKSTTAGWLVHVLVEAGADPSAFVGALLPASITGGPPATARWGGGTRSSSRPTSTPATSTHTSPALAILTSAEWDHPDVFADRAAVVDAFEAWLRRTPRGRDGRRQHRRPGRRGRPRSAGGLAGLVVAYALVDQAPQRLGGYARAIAERFATAPDPRRRCSAG